MEDGQSLEGHDDGVHIHGCQITVEHFENQFLADFASQKEAEYIVRGIRNADDLEFEKKMAHFNSNMHTGHPLITTIALLPPPELCDLSSSFVKGLCGPEYWQHRVQRNGSRTGFPEIARNGKTVPIGLKWRKMKMNWSETPPTHLGDKIVLVACGNGEIRTAKASELTAEHKSLTWIAWSD